MGGPGLQAWSFHPTSRSMQLIAAVPTWATDAIDNLTEDTALFLATVGANLAGVALTAAILLVVIRKIKEMDDVV